MIVLTEKELKDRARRRFDTVLMVCFASQAAFIALILLLSYIKSSFSLLLASFSLLLLALCVVLFYKKAFANLVFLEKQAIGKLSEIEAVSDDSIDQAIETYQGEDSFEDLSKQLEAAFRAQREGSQ